MTHKILTVFSLVVLLMFFSVCEKNVNPKQDLQDNDQEAGRWDLVWNDEFNSDVIDEQKWNKLLWRPGWVNNELQAYTDRDTNLFIRDGRLVIRGLIEPGYTGTDHTGTDYNADFTSGRMNTAGLATWTYGKFDIRARLPRGRGSWPAIWMLGTNISTAGWPHCGEIDIMEHVGYDDGNIHASIHTTDYNHMIGTQRSGQVTVQTATDSFHVYSLEWGSTYIRYLVNNDPYFFIYNDSNGNENRWPFDNPHYMILNLAIGGDWGGVQGIDYYQGATGPMIAHMLGMPHISGVTNLSLNGEKITAKRQIEGGLQVIDTSMPVLITCQKDMNKVRFPALKDIMMSKRKPFENREVPLEEGNDIDTSDCSLPPARGGGTIIDGETAEEKVDKLIEKLKTEAKVL